MQIRHSYILGSIVLFLLQHSPPLENKYSSECTHILQAWPTSPDRHKQFRESHHDVEESAASGVSNRPVWVVCIQDGRAALPASLCPPCRTFLWCFTRWWKPQQLDSDTSPTSNTLTAAEIQPLACTGALKERTAAAGVCSVPGASRPQRCVVVRNPAAPRPPVSP